jgi:PAS domain S-box-containing protein
LQQGAGLDALQICAPDGRQYAIVGLPIASDICAAPQESHFYLERGPADTAAWFLAAHPLTDAADGYGQVIVGVRLDDAYLARIRNQSGMEQILLFNGEILAFSGGAAREEWAAQLSAAPARLSAAPARLSTAPAQLSAYQFEDRAYYAAAIPWPEEAALLVALEVTDLAAAQRQLIGRMLGGILLAILIGSGLTLVLARRIGRPLDDLAAAASALSWRDLDRPVQVESQIAEVSQVAQALDFARVELRGALADLRQERDWVNHLLDSIVEGTLTLDADGRIAFFSQGAERVTGWSRQEAVGRRLDDLFQMADSAAPVSQFLPAAGQKERLTVLLADGRQAALAITGARLTPSAPGDAEIALVFRDVTEEEALRRLLGHFLANVAHEFRTPLSALAASIELLLDQSPDLSPAELQELLNALHLGTLGLQTLVDNLLESASIESGRFRVFLRPTDLNEVVAEAAQTMTPLIHKHGQRLRLDLPEELPVAMADGRRLTQVIVNLLSNAVKHGPDEAEIVLTATIGPQRVKISVADEGPGVPPEHRDDLFRWFMRRNPDEARPPFGIGLGLAVVKAVVLAHHGRVGIEDRPGGGSSFWIELPLEKEN